MLGYIPRYYATIIDMKKNNKELPSIEKKITCVLLKNNLLKIKIVCHCDTWKGKCYLMHLK